MPPRTIRRGELYWLDRESIERSPRRALLPPAPPDVVSSSDADRASLNHPILIVHSRAFESLWNFGVGVVVATLNEQTRAVHERKKWCAILEAHEVEIDETTTELGRARVAKCHQIYTFDADVLGTRLGVVVASAMGRVQACLGKVLGFEDP